MYAIIKTGGKQYRVEEGNVIKVEKLDAADGSTINFDEIMMVSKDGDVKVGQPFVTGCKVTGKVLGQGKNKKIIVFRYKAKKRIRTKTGHRQPYTKVLIEKIEA